MYDGLVAKQNHNMFLEKFFKKNKAQQPAKIKPFTGTLMIKIEYRLKDGRIGDRTITERIEFYDPDLFEAKYQKVLAQFSARLKGILDIVNKAHLSPNPYILIENLIIRKDEFVQAYIHLDNAKE